MLPRYTLRFKLKIQNKFVDLSESAESPRKTIRSKSIGSLDICGLSKQGSPLKLSVDSPRKSARTPRSTQKNLKSLLEQPAANDNGVKESAFDDTSSSFLPPSKQINFNPRSPPPVSAAPFSSLADDSPTSPAAANWATTQNIHSVFGYRAYPTAPLATLDAADVSYCSYSTNTTTSANRCPQVLSSEMNNNSFTTTTTAPTSAAALPRPPPDPPSNQNTPSKVSHAR